MNISSFSDPPIVWLSWIEAVAVNIFKQASAERCRWVNYMYFSSMQQHVEKSSLVGEPIF